MSNAESGALELLIILSTLLHIELLLIISRNEMETAKKPAALLRQSALPQ